MRYGAIAGSRRPASTAARFFSDPGPGNFYLGLSSPSRTPLATHETKYGAPVAVLRTFSTSGAPNYAAIDTIIAGGRIPWTSWKNPAGISIADIATGAGDAYIDGIAAGLAARAPWPVWWTFYHEPENDAPVSGVNAPTYRDAQRRMAQRIKAAGVTNSVFCAVNYQFPFTFGSASGRDWRIWYPDWKGTTAAGSTKFLPNPVDFYLDGDPNSVVEVIGLDFYHQFEIQDLPISPMTKWNDYTGPTMWAQRLQPMTQFLGKPYSIGEWSTAAAQDGIVFDPNADGTFTLTEYNAQVTAGTINYYAAQTDQWIDGYFSNKDNGVIAFCYWDDSSTKSTTEVATNPLGICDPAEQRFNRIGLWARSASAKVWTG
jgi:hypothetical protein